MIGNFLYEDIMKLAPALIVSLSLGPLWWPVDILCKVDWNTFNPTKLALAKAQFDILMKSTLEANRNSSSKFYGYISDLNELKNQPDSELLLEILDKTHKIAPISLDDEEMELLLLAKCTLAEAHIIFSTVLTLTGDIDLALAYWKGKVKNQQEKPFTDYIQTLPTQWKTQEEIQEKIDTLETMQGINSTYIGQLATFITNVQTLTNKTALRKLLSEHALKAGTFLENQKDTASTKTLDNKDLNRQLATNIGKVNAYEKNMDTSNRDLAEPGHLEKNWLWYASGFVGAIGLGAFIQQKRASRNAQGQTELDQMREEAHRGLRASYHSWWRNPIIRLKQLLTGGRRPQLIAPETLLEDENNFNISFGKVINDNIAAEEPLRRPWLMATYPHREEGIVALPGSFNSWDDVIEMDYNQLENPSLLREDILQAVNDSTQLDEYNGNYKQEVTTWVNKIFDWKRKYSENDQSALSQIQTDLGQKPLPTIADGRLPQVYNAQFQSFMISMKQFVANVSNQVNDMELTMKMLALLPASLVIYMIYKVGKTAHDKANSKEPMYKIMRHISREIGKILNKNNTYIKTSPSYEDQGYLIFWINKLREYAKELSGDEKDDFKEDLDELECEEYEVDQKLQTLQRMYNSYGFMRAGKQ